MFGIISLLILISLSSAGLLFHEYFKDLKFLIVPLLAVIMLSMGITLSLDDFKRILRQPFIVFYGALLQFTVMPLSAYLISLLIAKDIDTSIGIILVGSAPGGTASNLITFLSKGDLPYSISMTTVSTLISPLLTPFWTLVLAGKYVDVPFLPMVLTTSKIILLPVLGGMLIRKLLRDKVLKSIETFLPYISISAISLIIGIIFSLNRDFLLKPNTTVYLGILLHLIVGFSAGFLAGKLAKLDSKKIKALSIEVGMQNSGLAVVLALKYFSPNASVPPALFSLFQNIAGLLLSLMLRRK